VKYAVIIPEGGADLPIEELGGRTAFDAAATPNLDRVAETGRLGTVRTTPRGFEPASDVCSMSLLGYDPRRYHAGRAPLEAAAAGIQTGPRDWIFRLNFVTTGTGDGAEPGPGAVMVDHSAGALSGREARVLAADLMECWKREEPGLAAGLTLTPGAGYRSLLVDVSGREYARVSTVAPQQILGEPWVESLPGGEADGAASLRRLMEVSAEFLPGHEVNAARAEQGLRPATMAWIWGQGTRARVPAFAERFGLKGAMITGADLWAGLAAYLDLDRAGEPGMTGHRDTDYGARGRGVCAALDRYDMVCCQIDAPDEASHQGDAAGKVASLEAIDRGIIGPVLEKLRGFGDPEKEPEAEGWRLMVLPSHYTLVSTRKHDSTPVPFAMAGSWVRSVVRRPFNEKNAGESDLHIEEGHELMEYFLRGGLAGVKGASRGRAPMRGAGVREHG
jgi:2,3-bisphosphoglycerate-independent phosphoglycerate mutase